MVNALPGETTNTRKRGGYWKMICKLLWAYRLAGIREVGSRAHHNNTHMNMQRYLFLLAIGFGVASLQAQVSPLSPDPNPPAQIAGYKLVWSDEFNRTGKPDSANWRYELGFERNQELQWYQPDNANCHDGALHIVAKREKVKNPNYSTSANDWRRNREYAEYTASSIKTQGKQSWQYGRFLIRAKIPAFKGSWPAIWTLGVAQSWPSCGEIDIMEYYKNSILANVAWGTSVRYQAKWDTSMTPFSHFADKDSDWADTYHIWRMDWTKESVKLYLDDELLNETDLSETINANGTNPFHQPHYLLLNLAIGGQNGGDPSGTEFPLTYSIDYARVYQITE